MTQFDQRDQQVATQYNADHITIQQQPLSLTERQRKRNRRNMLELVQAVWITGVLEQSLRGTTQIALELSQQHHVTTNPWQLMFQELDQTGPLQLSDARVEQVYEHAEGEILILGEPGAGKTTLLLALARSLLERARRDELAPIPVVFNLSSWATMRQPLASWLVTELQTKYQISLPLATSWINTDQVLPLLDGLDEVPTGQRAACVEAINTYRRAHGLLPTVVCCRTTDYQALPRLQLRTAVVVQPLTREQVETYLVSAGEPLEALCRAFRDDPDLQTLASTPLMLNVLTVTYQKMPREEIAPTSSIGMKQEQIFAFYVRRMLKRRRTSVRYTAQQTVRWLTYLARQMQQHSQAIFYIEQLQSDWLPDSRGSQVYDWFAVRLPGVLVGMLISLIIVLLFDANSPSFAAIFLFILPGGWLGGLLSGGNTTQRLSVRKEKTKNARRFRLLFCIGTGVFFGLSLGLSFGLADTEIFQSDVVGVISGVISGLGIGLSFGFGSILILNFLEKGHTAEASSQTSLPARGMIWRRLIKSRGIRTGLLIGLSSALPVGLSLGSITALLVGPSNGLGNGLLTGVLSGLSTGLSYGSIYGLIGGFLGELLLERSRTIQVTDRLVWSWSNLDFAHDWNGKLE